MHEERSSPSPPPHNKWNVNGVSTAVSYHDAGPSSPVDSVPVTKRFLDSWPGAHYSGTQMSSRKARMRRTRSTETLSDMDAIASNLSDERVRDRDLDDFDFGEGVRKTGGKPVAPSESIETLPDSWPGAHHSDTPAIASTRSAEHVRRRDYNIAFAESVWSKESSSPSA